MKNNQVKKKVVVKFLFNNIMDEPELFIFMPKIYRIFFSLIFFSQIYPQNLVDGTAVPILSAKSALQAPMGVRALGMGQANTGRSDDLSALRYNPAGLALMGYTEWGLSSHSLPESVQANSLAISTGLPYGSIGLFGQWLTVRDNQQVNAGQHSHPDRNKYSYQAGLSYGASLPNKHFHAGGTIKFFGADYSSGRQETSSYPVNSRGIFFDLGVLATYDLSDLKGIFFYLPKVSAGFAMRNLHPLFRLKNEVYKDYHPEYVTGISLYYRYRFMLNADMALSPDLPAIFRWGMEIWPIYFLAIRLGTSRQANITGAYWGFGIGESVGKSKVSFEYAGQVYFERAVYHNSGNIQNLPRISGLGETFHSFAIHQSFEFSRTYQDYYGKIRTVPIAISDRYISAYRFSREIQPEEILDDAVLAIKKTEPGYIEQKDEFPVEPSEKENAEAKTEQKKFVVALFPVVEYYVSSEPYGNSYAQDLYRNFLDYLQSKKNKLTLVSQWRMKNTPRREQGESQVNYLARLCRFHQAEILILPNLDIDKKEGFLTARIIYYKANDREISAMSEFKNSEDRYEILKKNLVQDIGLQLATLLDINLKVP